MVKPVGKLETLEQKYHFKTKENIKLLFESISILLYLMNFSVSEHGTIRGEDVKGDAYNVPLGEILQNMRKDYTDFLKAKEKGVNG